MVISRSLPCSVFSSIVNSLSDTAVVVVDSFDNILFWNQAAERAFGYSEEDILGQPLSIVIPLAERSIILDKNADKENHEVENYAISKDQWKVPIRITRIQLLDEQDLTAFVIRDITKEKASDRRLIRSQQLGRVGSWERDIKTGNLYWTDEMFRICGIGPKDDMTVEEYLTYIHPDDVDQVQHAINMTDAGDSYDLQYRVVRPSGEIRWVHAQGELDSEDGNSGSVFGCLKDITLYKQYVDELTRSEENLKFAQRLAKLGHWEWDIQKDHVIWSDEIYSIVGWRPSDFGKTYEAFLELVHPDDRDYAHKSIGHALNGEDLNVEYRFRRADNNYCILHVVGQAYRDESGTPLRLFGTCQDVTDKRKTEQMLIRSEKLAVVGQLTAGFAHEIRNPLTALKGFTRLLQARPIDVHKQYYDIMVGELGRIESIVDDLLVLARPQVYATIRVIIQRVLEEVITLLRPQAMMYNVEFSVDGRGDTVVDCDPNQMKQVFLNLIKNAIEAMPSGGKLAIGFRRTEEKLEIQFTDQGAGISNEVISKIGEPFYTTKPGGTGLGIMVSQRILAAHNGNMHIVSQEGVGTTVCVELPVYISGGIIDEVGNPIYDTCGVGGLS